ncbi:hypothetical protein G3444_10420 [Shewanella baltica]|jgi:hypothetical protein|uniref:DUF6058 family natural product biosynthesis protein n=1 Tax=Shewanella baltica TaxID=62322 RepID=UPI00217DFE7B|nr:DUF6058 family natural product biosynthesis protein [Shewanella baltica]MCS6119317.1 hypothetical protein [Shewanella baltica]MCS6124175.1 hypothetical protein [Shewanella baltica]
MLLLEYLNAHFYTRQQLLEVTGQTEARLINYQTQGVMPACSYRLQLSIVCDSVFGTHNEQLAIEYYAKGYGAWLTMLHQLDTDTDIYPIFQRRYLEAIEKLTAPEGNGLERIPDIILEQHIQQEWEHFLAGTYGLCTQSGLPEDIAAKELAIITINALTSKDELSHNELLKLTTAVTLLDEVSAAFAPHEKSRSSRYRLVDEIRRRYRLADHANTWP